MIGEMTTRGLCNDKIKPKDYGWKHRQNNKNTTTKPCSSLKLISPAPVPTSMMSRMRHVLLSAPWSVENNDDIAKDKENRKLQ